MVVQLAEQGDPSLHVTIGQLKAIREQISQLET